MQSIRGKKKKKELLEMRRMLVLSTGGIRFCLQSVWGLETGKVSLFRCGYLPDQTVLENAFISCTGLFMSFN